MNHIEILTNRDVDMPEELNRSKENLTMRERMEEALMVVTSGVMGIMLSPILATAAIMCTSCSLLYVLLNSIKFAILNKTWSDTINPGYIPPDNEGEFGEENNHDTKHPNNINHRHKLVKESLYLLTTLIKFGAIATICLPVISTFGNISTILPFKRDHKDTLGQTMRKEKLGVLFTAFSSLCYSIHTAPMFFGIDKTLQETVQSENSKIKSKLHKI